MKSTSKVNCMTMRSFMVRYTAVIGTSYQKQRLRSAHFLLTRAVVGRGGGGGMKTTRT